MQSTKKGVDVKKEMLLMSIIVLCLIITGCGGGSSPTPPPEDSAEGWPPTEEIDQIDEVEDFYYAMFIPDPYDYTEEELARWEELMAQRDDAYFDRDIDFLQYIAQQLIYLDDEHWSAPPASLETIDFIFAYEDIFTGDNKGYSISTTFKSWYGVLGTGQEMPHPYDTSIIIPAVDNQTLIIPYYVETQNTTSDSSFKQELWMSVEPHFKSISMSSVYFGGSWIQLTERSEARVISESRSGDKIVFPGYYTLPNIVSPELPTPDLENLGYALKSHGLTVTSRIGEVLAKDKRSIFGEGFYPMQEEQGITITSSRRSINWN